MRGRAVAAGREFGPNWGARAAGGKLCFAGEFVQALLEAPDYVKFEIPEDVLAKLRSAVVADESAFGRAGRAKSARVRP